MTKKQNDTIKNYLYIIGAVVALVSTIVGVATGYANLRQSAAETQKKVKKQACRIDSNENRVNQVEKTLIAQSVTLGYIKQKQQESHEKQNRIIDILEKMTQKEN